MSMPRPLGDERVLESKTSRSRRKGGAPGESDMASGGRGSPRGNRRAMARAVAGEEGFAMGEAPAVP